jgi:MFS transporter, DHA1 family, inner membrane transport protein
MTTVEQSYLPRRLYPRLAILAVGLFVVGTNAFVIAGLLPTIARSLGVGASAVSYSITYYSIVVAVVAPVVSIVFARVSRTTLIAVGLVLVSVGTVIAAAAPDLLVFTLGRVVAAFGGAALVPAATAAAASLAPAARRGSAIAFVGVGFTASTAFGAPLGTAIAAGGDWRLPLYGLAGLALLTAGAVALAVRHIPLGPVVSVRRRFSVLANPQLVLTLVATLLVVAGFNVVYIFSSAVVAGATGGSSSLLAALLLVFGVAGIGGTFAAGRLTDRFGSRATGTAFLGVLLVVVAVLPLVSSTFVATAIVFAIWGVSANGAPLAFQHRLVEIDPATSGVALSWYSTAMYAGIALAPPLGATAIGLGNPQLVPVFGAIAVAVALVTFSVGARARRDSALQAERA